MHETVDELAALQELLDTSLAAAGPHLRSVISEARRLDAAGLCEQMRGMCLLAVATVTADGRPLVGPVDGYLLHGSLHFSSGRDSVRMRHLATRSAVSATWVPAEQLAVTVHGDAELYRVNDPERGDLRQAMLDWYLPRQGSAFTTWLDDLDPLAARIRARRMFVFNGL